MTNNTSHDLARRFARLAALCLVVGGLAACDDGEDNGTTDTGGAGGSGDMLPPTDGGRDAMTDMMVVPDVGPDMIVPDMGPDMGECTEDDQCAVDSICDTGSCVGGQCVVTPIEGCCDEDADCGDGGRCLGALNVCAVAGVPGSVVITELMVDPAERADDAGEWIEIHNPTDAPVQLNGWQIGGGEGESHTITGDAPIVLEPGAWFVLARSADAVAPVAVNYVYDGVDLVNTGDTISLLDAFGTTIDGVTYGEGWPVQAGRSLSVSGDAVDAAGNDAPEAWCVGEPSWGGEDRGTPGAENPVCPGGPEPIDWCRLQWPLDAEHIAGEEITFYGRVAEAGITDRTDGTDADERLLAQVGYGPDATEPADNADWTWFDAAPNAGWSAETEGEPGNDEYSAVVAAPAEGTYDHAFRFSADGGQTWTYCDRRTEAGDGSADGYQVENAGSLITAAGPCEPNPCVTPPAAACVGNTAVTYVAEGACSIDGEGFACDYAVAEEVDCAVDGNVCAEGACVAPEPLPEAGQLVITEILYDPHDVIEEDVGEWFEVHNPTDAALRLDGCTVVDATPDNVEVIERLVIPAGGYAVFARSADPAVNGGIENVAHVFGFGLNNGGDTITLQCGETVIDQVAYDDGAPFPIDARRQSIALDPESVGAAENDDGANWCYADDVYFQAEDPAFNHAGTPGAANPPCPVPDVTVDWCRLQAPTDVESGAATQLTVFGRVFEAGITDLSEATDADEDLMAQLGWGADGSDPAAADAMWTWIDALPNEAWVDAAEPGNDEYMATFAVPAPGAYDFAYRFSRDGGMTWLYCDRDAGEAADGSEDGYQADNAGQLTSLPSPCEVEACDAAPEPTCADDGVTRITYTAPGACEEVDGAAVCTYGEETEDCSVTGGTCEAGACVGGAALPAAGEVRFTEFMANPHDPLADATAEWFELTNVSDHAVTLNGCTLVDNFENNAEVVGPIVLEAGAIAVFAKSDDAAVNGGLPAPTGLFGFGLNNGGDQLNLICGDVTIDSVDYSAPDFPDVRERTAIQRTGDTWCPAGDIYFGEGAQAHRGTPGAANPACPSVAACNLQWPEVIAGAPGAETVVYGRVTVPGISDATEVTDVDPRVWAQLGWGPDASDPATSDAWTWQRADANPGFMNAEGVDEYQSTLINPAQPGVFDYAYRFSADSGRTWTYCDLDGIENGYAPEQAGALTVQAEGDPCDPNPCDAPPAAECDGNTVVSYVAEGACENDNGAPVCTYAEAARVDCEEGEACVNGACQPANARGPAEGEIIFTELLYDPHGAVLTENDAEWIEIHNTTDEPLSLDGCTVGKGDQRDALDGLVLDAGAWAVLTKGAADVNGGIAPFGSFTFALSNSGTTLDLTCGELAIDAVSYDDAAPWPRDAQRHSISLDAGALNAAANDDGANWCYGRAIYWANDAEPADDHRGTPGAANPACAEPVDFCRLQAPLQIEGAPGTEVAVYGRIYEEGTTDRTNGTDRRQHIQAQLGWGPDASAPADNEAWVWQFAGANAEWDSGDDNDEDEYVSTLTVPAMAGQFDYAWRFSADGGRTWTYCDSGEGSADGYQPENAGVLNVVIENVCDPNPCNEPPAADCADETTRRVFPAEGACVDLDGVADCSYDAELVPCAEGETCADGACRVAGARAPAMGEIIFTELLYDPHGDVLSENNAEWIEIHNTTDEPLALDGCTVGKGDQRDALDGLVLGANAWAVLTKGAADVNGGIAPFGSFTFALSNSGTGIDLACGDLVIDAVSYDDAAPWPRDAQRHSISLDAAQLTAAGNDDGANWCYGRPVYWMNDADPADDHRGTPGAANPSCAEPVDFCRLQSPTEVEGFEGDEVVVFGRLYEEGTTDRHPGNDVRQHVMVQFGWAVDGADAADWVWTMAQPNPAWDGAAMGVENEDEYQASWALPGEGLYDYGFRASVDGGRTWTLCDGDAEGNTDGFDEPGVALVNAQVDPCVPNPCDAPPAATCADENTRRSFPAEGACEVQEGQPVCTYAPIDEACAEGEICEDGACVEVGGAATPAAGEVIFTEIMYDPHGDLSDATAEWFELHNPTDAELSLSDCSVTANGNGGPIGDMVIPAGGWLVFAKTADANGGFEIAGTFDFALGNGGSTLVLTCADQMVDTVAYDDGGEWPRDARAHSISLDAETLDAAANDVAGNWCFGRALYYQDADDPALDNRGTPGAANPPCDEPVDFCRLQAPTEIDGTVGDAVTVYGRLYEEGTTDRHPGNDRRQYVRAEFGWGADDALPADWTWVGASANADWMGEGEAVNEDEYQFNWLLPAEGLYDYGFRFSVDGGRTWTLCDADAEGNTDGFDEPGVALTAAPADPCADVVCDTAPAATCVDADTRRVYADQGACEVNAEGLGECAYPSDDIDCAEGETCVNGACEAQGPRAPVQGEVIFSEILYDPHGTLAEGAAEWFELHNTTDEPLALEGCTVSSSAGQVVIGDLVAPADGWILFAQTDDQAANGGLTPDALFDFALGNGGATLTLTCAEQIDVVTYDDEGDWPRDARRNSVSLDPGALTAADNDAGTNWCFGRTLYYDSAVNVTDDHNGTPGAANMACDKVVDWCRVQAPTEVDAVVGDTVRAFLRLTEEGLSDRWAGTDNLQFVQVQFGFGPDGVDPANWSWERASTNLDWRAPAGSIEDEYLYEWNLPGEGLYSYGFRVSINGGRTWALCDADAEGNTDGFDEPGVALVSAAASCEPNPCNTPPAADCADDTTVRTYPAMGACEIVDNTSECTYAPELTACGANEQCVDGACVGPRAPAAGEVIINEIMYDPHGALADGRAEWVELYNTTDETLNLEGCTFTANNNGGALPANVIEPHGYFVIGQVPEQADNGGLDFDAIVAFAAGNGGSTLELNCSGDPATPTDTVSYDDAAPWPRDAQRHSISLDLDARDADANDDGANWCFGRGLYYQNDNIVDDHRGTPGMANPACDEPVDFCRLQAPTEIDATAGDVVTVYGRVYEEGTTDRTPRTDARQYVMAQFGWGADGVAPADWTWASAAPNGDWMGMDAGINHDEYQYDWTLPAEGIYSFGYRFSVDGGRTWTLCDGDVEGNIDDFDEPGVALTVNAVDVCDPNPCNAAPADTCVDADTALIYADGDGSCEAVDGAAVCTYDNVEVDCDAGQVCENGACVVPPPPTPAPGEVIINEIMYDPHGPLADGTAEWIELRNTTDGPLSLGGCALTANNNGGAFAEGLVIAANGFVLVGQNDDAAANGGLQLDAVMNIAFGNGGSTVVLDCDGDAANPTDAVSYDDGGAWPRDAQRHSIALDPSADGAGNDDAANWCYGRMAYYVDAAPAEDHRGTPGAANPACDEPVDACRVQAPTEIDGTEGDEVVVLGRLIEAGTTDRHPGNDVRQYVMVQFGWGADGADPADWAWQAAMPTPDWDGAAAGAENEDQYQSMWTLPAEGIYSFGYRASVDGGRTWTLCDADAEGSTDGFDEPGVALAAAGDPCSGVVCDQPPANECADGTTQAVYEAEGTCNVVDGAAQCDYDFDFVACPDGQVCDDGTGACAPPPAPAPQVGEIAFTEVMYDTNAPLDETLSEWFEIHNQTDVELDLSTCVINDSSNNDTLSLDGLRIEPDAYMVFARSTDAAVNGGIENVARAFAFALNNGGDSLTLVCNDDAANPIDALVYADNADNWPDARGASTQLDAMRDDEIDTDDGRLWCTTATTYGDEGHFGTPGAANTNCEVDFCRLQWNPDVRTTWGETTGYFTQFYRFGVTDQAQAAPDSWMVEMGFGPNGEAPDSDNWVWAAAAPNDGWDFGANNNDEWTVDFVAPEVIGQFDTLFRISTDGGQRWTYCDADDAGNTNGLEAPGDLIIGAPAFTQQEVQARFNQSCTGCHGGAGGLDLRDDFTLTTINVPANGPAQPMDLIEPGAPEASYLFLKMSNTHRLVGGGGNQMPPGGLWSQEDLSRLAAYIQAL